MKTTLDLVNQVINDIWIEKENKNIIKRWKQMLQMKVPNIPLNIQKYT